MYISMGWTTPAFLAGKKTETRRNWTDKHAAKFKIGRSIEVWDKSPAWINHKVKPRKVGKLIIIDIFKEMMTPYTFYNSFVAEGFCFISQTNNEKVIKIKKKWENNNNYLWVLKFKKI